MAINFITTALLKMDGFYGADEQRGDRHATDEWFEKAALAGRRHGREPPTMPGGRWRHEVKSRSEYLGVCMAAGCWYRRNATGTSIFASDVLGEMVATFGSKLYSDVDQSSPTDITGIVTITAGNNFQWSEWQYETTKYIVGTNGVDPVIKWTGSGTACSAARASAPRSVPAAQGPADAWYRWPARR